jgi:hypothetical protein
LTFSGTLEFATTARTEDNQDQAKWQRRAAN